MKFYDLTFRLEEMTESQKRIADFIVKDASRLAYMTEEDIARELSMSAATVSRFWRSIGFENNKAFKAYLKEKTSTTPANKLEDILSKTEAGDLPANMFQLAAGHIQETLRRLEAKRFDQAVCTLATARTIYLYGPGPCESLVDLMQFRLNRLGLAVRKIAKSGHEIFETLINFTSADVVVLFGFVNTLREIRVLLDHSKKVGTRTILITDLLVSEMIEQSDIVLYTARGELWEFHSMVAPVVLIESLIVAVSQYSERESLSRLNALHELRKEYESYIPRY